MLRVEPGKQQNLLLWEESCCQGLHSNFLATEMQQKDSENICHSHYLQGLQSAHSTDGDHQQWPPCSWGFSFPPKGKMENKYNADEENVLCQYTEIAIEL